MAIDAVPNQPQGPPAVPPPQLILQPLPSMFGRLGKLLAFALGIAIVIILGLIGSYHSYFGTADRPQEKFHSLSRDATKKVALINIAGAIYDTENGFVKKQIDSVKDDNDVVAIVLRIDSPGGTVGGSDYLYHHLRKLVDERKLPMVVSMGNICASGGYYVAMAVGNQPDAIFAEPTTWTGSIGVIIPHFDFSGLLGRWNVKDDSIVSGPLKEMASPTRPMTADERKLLQELVDETFGQFKAIVANGRPKFKDNPQALDAVATGQVFAAKQALDRGLIDKIGFIEDAVNRAAELSGYPTDQLRCVKYEERTTFFGWLFGSESMSSLRQYNLDPAAWLDLTAPRAYYLWTWLPAAIANDRP